MATTSTPRGALHLVRILLTASHPGPTIAVTTIAALLCIAVDLDARRAVLLIASVLAGQLSIGWGNDLLDLHRDRRAGRTDKPLATGDLGQRMVQIAAVIALGLAALLPLPLGIGPPAAALWLIVVGGQTYNLGLKRTGLSWLPYAVAFASLAAAPGLAADVDVAWWVPLVGALLGVGAHLVNVLPDLDDDARTGVSGFPHRVADRHGARAVSVMAVVLFVIASAILLVALPFGPLVVVAGLVVITLAALALRTGGRRPFQAAMAIALVDVVALVLAI
ncbi:UbiA family prenyltransferase [Aeromicrobium sp. CF3.5]|uniref:UbiA family prenyltransferase n=1 Tax=Aeromicrobium sp. CF3.5 TaxID=3373078 RepID=UPI003EE60516